MLVLGEGVVVLVAAPSFTATQQTTVRAQRFHDTTPGLVAHGTAESLHMLWRKPAPIFQPAEYLFWCTAFRQHCSLCSLQGTIARAVHLPASVL